MIKEKTMKTSLKQPQLSRLAVAITALFATCGAALVYLYKHGQGVEITTTKPGMTSCLDWGRLCFSNLPDTIRLTDINGLPTDYRGQTWGMAWGNANDNEWPDLYLNHHRETNTAGRFPTSHLILDIGLHNNTQHFLALGGGDQHSALFVDLNHDGKEEILETIGGRRGTADASNTGTHNQVHFVKKAGESPPKEYQSSIKDAVALGLDQAGARGRQVSQFNLQGTSYIAFLNQSRKDGKYGPNIMRRKSDDSFAKSTLQARLCHLGKCKDEAFSLERYRSLTYGLISDDSSPDLALCQNNRDADIKALVSKSQSEKPVIAKSDLGLKTRYCLSGFFPSASKNLLITETSSTIRFMHYAPKQNKLVTFHELPLINGERSRDIALGDLNNDGNPDIISLQKTKQKGGNAASLAIYLSQDRGCTASHPFSCYISKVIHIVNTPSPRNFTIADYNNDGALDILIGAGKTKPGPFKGGRYVLLMGKNPGNWLSLNLKCRDGNKAIGALASIQNASSKAASYLQTSGARHEVQDDSRIHIGFGRASANDVAIKITWPNGEPSSIRPQSLNQSLTINGGSKCS